MKKLNYRAFLGLGLLASMAALGAGCNEEASENMVKAGVLNLHVSAIPAQNLKGIEANVQILWTVDGLPYDSDSYGGLVVPLSQGGTGIFNKSLGFSQSLQAERDITIDEVNVDLTDTFGTTLYGTDSDPTADYVATGQLLKINANVVVSESGGDSNNVARIRTNRLLGKNRVKLPSAALRFDRREKNLPAESLGSMLMKASAGAAR